MPNVRDFQREVHGRTIHTRTHDPTMLTQLFQQPHMMRLTANTLRTTTTNTTLFQQLGKTRTQMVILSRNNRVLPSSSSSGMTAAIRLLSSTSNDELWQSPPRQERRNPLRPNILLKRQQPVWNNDDNNNDDHNSDRSGGGIMRKVGIGGSALLLLSSLAGKAKFLLVALKLTKLSSLASMFASMGMYSMIYGPKYAAGIVGMLVVHEVGHILAMINFKIPFSAPMFVPFMGAFVAGAPAKNAYHASLVALAGPAVGSAGALAVSATGMAMDSQILMHIGDAGIMLNMFNLLPIAPLDGGQVAAQLSKWALVAGFGGGVALAYTGVVQSPLFYLIVAMSGLSTVGRFMGEEPSTKYRLNREQRATVLTLYFGLITALLFTQYFTKSKRKSAQQIKKEMEAKGELGPGWDEKSAWDGLSDFSARMSDDEVDI